MDLEETNNISTIFVDIKDCLNQEKITKKIEIFIHIISEVKEDELTKLKITKLINGKEICKLKEISLTNFYIPDDFINYVEDLLLNENFRKKIELYYSIRKESSEERCLLDDDIVHDKDYIFDRELFKKINLIELNISKFLGLLKNKLIGDSGYGSTDDSY